MIQLWNWFRRGSLERGLDRELQYLSLIHI